MADKHLTYPPESKYSEPGTKIEGCSFCQMADPKGYAFINDDMGHPPDKPYQAFLCDVCYGTKGGNANHFPRQYEPIGLYQMMAQCTNKVLRHIEKATYSDGPDLDGTDGAHPAWWRGHEQSMDKATEQLAKVVGESRWTTASDWKSLLKGLKDRLRFHSVAELLADHPDKGPMLEAISTLVKREAEKKAYQIIKGEVEKITALEQQVADLTDQVTQLELQLR